MPVVLGLVVVVGFVYPKGPAGKLIVFNGAIRM
jgi:hypothetical protein